jgi:hypothetical protein
MVFLAIAARISPTRASPCRCSAVARSNSDCEMTRSFSSPRMRSKLRRARSRCASAAVNCACSCRVSSNASTSPSFTAVPDSKAILSTVPGRSALTVTPWTAATVPIELKLADHSS